MFRFFSFAIVQCEVQCRCHCIHSVLKPIRARFLPSTNFEKLQLFYGVFVQLCMHVNSQLTDKQCIIDMHNFVTVLSLGRLFDTNKSLEKSLTTLSWLVTVNVDELRRKHEKEDKGKIYRTFGYNAIYASK